MKNDFHNDDWLKEQLSDEYINDDDFSFSVVKKIAWHETKSKRIFYAVLLVMITLFSFLFIPDLMMIIAGNSTSRLVSAQQFLPFMQMEYIGIFVILLSFALIWSFENSDLI
ncbi:MAG: hypothetical protein HRT53_10960 [Colwellia sp.]|nr:hypothetical protein [Colwellia sp.]